MFSRVNVRLPQPNSCYLSLCALLMFALPLGVHSGQVLIWGTAQAVTNVPPTATNLVSIAGGDFHASAIRRDGTVITWGPDNWQGFIFGITNVPEGLSNVVSVAGGGAHTLALRSDGSLALWGAVVGDSGLIDSTNLPPDATNVAALAPGTGAHHALVLRADGIPVDWGMTSPELTNVPSMARHIVAVAAGSWHAVALRADGRVVAWGDSSYGSGQTNVPASATNIVAIAANEGGGAALRADGTVITWGGGGFLTVAGVNNAVDVACMRNTHSVLVLKRDGKLTKSGSGASPPSQATNIAAIATTSDNGIAMIGEGSPVFPGLPLNRTVVSGARAYFRGVATGAFPISYQWAYNGTNIDGATNTVLVVTNAQPTNMGAYSLVASNALGMATNGSMMLDVLAVEITQDPQDKLQYLGGTTNFSVVAEGQGPLKYQWLFNAAPIQDATNAVLSLTNLQATAAGDYSVIVSNVHGAAHSSTGHLRLQPILITSQPPAQTTLINSNRTLSVVAIGDGLLTYQWQLYGTNLPLATNASLNLPSVGLTDAGSYTVLITNVYGSTNISFTLTVVPSIVTSLPGNQPMFRGGTANFALGIQTLIPINYQWFCNGNPLGGATNSTLPLTNVQNDQAGTYSVVFSNAFQVVTNNAWLAVVEVAAWGQYNNQTNVPPNATNLMAIAAGASHSIALQPGSQIVGWGNALAGETAAPPSFTNGIAISAGSSTSLGLRTNGMVLTWGQSSFGRSNVPPDLTNTVAVAAGGLHVLALTSDGFVKAWGDNRYGQTNVPVGLSGVVGMSAGQYHSLALKADGTVAAWGAGTNYSGSANNYGQAAVPAGLSNVVQVAAGGSFSLALKSDGTMQAWGRNTYGQTNIPSGLSNVVAIAAGFAHWLALSADGTVITKGPNNYGQTNVPFGLTNVMAIAANPNGEASLAQIGNGPPVQHAILLGPVLGEAGFSVTLPTQSGRVYRLEFATAVDSTVWSPLPLVAGNGANVTLLDPKASENVQRYYRVRRW